jgi:hypothetical protein
LNGVMWASGLLISTVFNSAPWWGYDKGRHKLQTTNTIAFFECTEIT